MAYTCKACMNIPTVRLCADRVRCQPEMSMVTEWDVSVTEIVCRYIIAFYSMSMATCIYAFDA